MQIKDTVSHYTQNIRQRATHIAPNIIKSLSMLYLS